MPVTLAIDFGSTYTKVVALDTQAGLLLGVAQAPTTVATDINFGLDEALRRLERICGIRRGDVSTKVASSSAAGGLRMVAIGLVPDLTAQAARLAALGAGAKILKVYSYQLTSSDLREIAQIAPDMIMLAGGTDGGDSKTLLSNARALAQLAPPAPIVVCGNRAVSDEALASLLAAGCTATVVENVLPELGRINVDPARAEIRRIFMERITHAKGLDRAQAYVGQIVMPTPMAVLEAARILAEGAPGEQGLGELVVVDVGGATTDVHSAARGMPTNPRMIPRGIPEPYTKRTVEGDLGVRINAPTIAEHAGMQQLASIFPTGFSADECTRHIERLARETDYVPQHEWEHEVDAGLAGIAVELAMMRHAGTVETIYTPEGPVQVLHGKDLTAVETVVATGGVFAYGHLGHRILGKAAFDEAKPISMRPRAPACLVDSRYILFAMGLIAPLAPAAAVHIMKQHLVGMKAAPAPVLADSAA